MTLRYLAGDGEPIARLARRFGLSRQTIYNHLARATTAPAPMTIPRLGSSTPPSTSTRPHATGLPPRAANTTSQSRTTLGHARLLPSSSIQVLTLPPR